MPTAQPTTVESKGLQIMTTTQARRSDIGQSMWRLRYGIIVAATIASAIVAGGRGDWNLFADAGRAMIGGSGFAVFAEHAQVQTGPISLLVARIFATTPRNGFVLSAAVCALLGVLVVRELYRSSARQTHHKHLAILGGAILMFTWGKLGGYGHLDDAVVLAAAVYVDVLMRRDRRLPAAILVGLSIAVKPWAIIFVPLTIGSAGSWRARLKGPLISLVIGGVLWAPFVLLNPRTVDSMRPSVKLAPDSVLRLIGIGGDDLPAAFRSAQMLVALVLATIAAIRRRPAGIILVAIAARLALDPGTWSYYTPGLALGAFVWDMTERRRSIPWATILAAGLLAPSWVVGSADLRSWLRLAACATAVLAVFAAPKRPTVLPTYGAMRSVTAGDGLLACG